MVSLYLNTSILSGHIRNWNTPMA